MSCCKYIDGEGWGGQGRRETDRERERGQSREKPMAKFAPWNSVSRNPPRQSRFPPPPRNGVFKAAQSKVGKVEIRKEEKSSNKLFILR